MARRVFLDVGGHLGETLAEAVKPHWRFDAIATFEPASACWPALEALADERVSVVHAGWWTEDTTMELHDPGEIGASVAAAKARTAQVEQCQFIDAATWMQAHVTPTDQVWLKMNCEGAECAVLDHLLDARALPADVRLVVHFDVEKVPGLEAQAGRMRARLRSEGVQFVEAKEILFGRSHAKKTANWLAWTEAGRFGRFRYAHLAKWEFRARQLLYPLKQRIVARKR